MNEPRCVIDTNVYISAAISPRGKPNQVVFEVIRRGNVLVSAETLYELETRLQRSRFDKYLSLEGRTAFFDFINDRSIVVDASERITACADPDDDKFLELAVSGGADFIITGNLRDFPPSPFQGIEIVNPAEFLSLMPPS